MSGLLHRLGAACARHGWRVLGIWLVVFLGIGVLAATVGGEVVDEFSVPGTESQHAADVLRSTFPAAAGGTARVVLSAKQGTLADHRAEVAAVLGDIATQPGVLAVGDPF